MLCNDSPTQQVFSEQEARANEKHRINSEKLKLRKEMTLVETQTESRPVSARPTESNELSKLIKQYGCGTVQFTGTNDELYERHLVFDNVMDAAAIGARLVPTPSEAV